MHTRCDVLVVGGGMAAARLAQELDQRGYSGQVAIASAEPVAGYNRVLLPGYLGGECDLGGMMPAATPWLDAERFSLLAGADVVALDVQGKSARCADDSCIDFDKLVLATGSNVPRPEVPGMDGPVVTEFRTLADADRLAAMVSAGGECVVVGGGLLGLEAADALVKKGVRVHVVHRSARLMTRQLDDAGGEMLRTALEQRGITVHLNTTVDAIVCGPQQTWQARLSNGAHPDVDAVVVATGALPNDALARQAGLRCDNGVVTDEQMQTSAADVFALGECANQGGYRHQLVEPVYAQAEALAATLCGEPSTARAPAPNTRLKMDSIALFSAGHIRPQAGEDITIIQAEAGVYRRLLFDGATLVGAVLLGDISAAREIASRIGTRLDAQMCERLAFAI